MSKLNVPEFIDLVKRSKLVDTDRLDELLARLAPPPADSPALGAQLVEAGLLTPWQCERLLAGRYKGFILGKYKLLGHLGTGGMSSVFLAEHLVMRHQVAVKVLPHNLVRQSSYLERFHQEARATALLSHPNMVRAFDVDAEGDTYYLVMEFVDGKDMKALVDRDGPLPYKVAADYARQAADGLSYAHGRGLIHRDIKPANLLVDTTGTVKILDLGLARFSDESLASLTVDYDENMIGTVDYLAPEQALDSHNVDARADIYSLGCTLYFMLTGAPPFGDGTIPQRLMKHQKEEPASIRRKRPDAPEELISICIRMMAKTPATRHQSAAEVSELLTSWLNGESTSHGGIGKLPAAPPPPSTGPVIREEDLTLAPLEDEPGRPIAPLPTRAANNGQTGKSAAPSPPPVPAELARAQKASRERKVPAARQRAQVVKMKESAPPVGAAARPVSERAPAAADTLDELLTDSASRDSASLSADWSAGSPLLMPQKSDSVWRVIGMGSLLGIGLLILLFLVYAISAAMR